MSAMVTPFGADGAVDFDLAVEIAEYLVENGTDTVLLAGTTGESPTLTHDEEFELFRIVLKALKGKAKVMAGAGSNSTRTAVEVSLKAQEIGVDGLLHVVPYYNKPSQAGMIAHFRSIAEAVELPILLYNIPGRTGVNMLPETMAELATVSTIFGVKEAAGNLEQVKQIRAACPEDFLIYSGDDALTLDFMKEGAVGAVSVASHVVGKSIREMMDLFLTGDLAGAEALNGRLAELFEVLFVAPNPVPVKCALRALGFGVGGVRLPLIDVTSEEKLRIEAVLDRVLGVSE